MPDSEAVSVVSAHILPRGGGDKDNALTVNLLFIVKERHFLGALETGLVPSEKCTTQSMRSSDGSQPQRKCFKADTACSQRARAA